MHLGTTVGRTLWRQIQMVEVVAGGAAGKQGKGQRGQGITPKEMFSVT